MNINVASQNQGIVAFTGVAVAAVSSPIDLRHHVNFGFTFNILADIGADTKFKVQSAPPSDADPCLPGNFVDVPEVVTCDWLTRQGAATSEILIPAGTKKGAICSGTLPCKPDAFVQIVPVSGETADVQVVAVLGGPR